MHKFTSEIKAFSLGPIFGIICKQGNKISAGLLPDDLEIFQKENKALAAQQVESSPGGDLNIVTDCRLDYREELASKLNISLEDLDGFSDGQLILKSYSKWGKSCVEHFIGDFVFAILDQKQDVLFCARDHMGCRPFFYYEDSHYFLFSSNFKRFEAVPGVSFLPREKYLLHLFHSKALPVNETLYEGMNRLAPAHSLLYDSKSSPVIKRYWDLEIDPDHSSLSFDEAIETYTELLEEAVGQRVRKTPNFGLELSGGLDSSAIATLANEVIQDGTRMMAFSNVLPREHLQQFFPYIDEAEYAKKVIAHVGIDKIQLEEVREESSSMEAVSGAMELIHGPLFQVYPAFSNQLLNKVEEQDLHLLLSGFGGDECATYTARGILHEFADQGKWDKVGMSIKDEPVIKKMLVFVRLFFEHKIFKHNSVRIRRLFKIGQPRYSFSDLAMNSAFRTKFKKLEKERHKARIRPDYRIREQQRARLTHENLSNRMENSYLMAQERNIEYAYPLLDIRLLSLVYSLPAEYQYRKGLGRYLMRAAMKDLLPDEIRLRNNKFGLPIPNIFYRIHLDQDEYLKLIEEGEKNNRFHYLDYNKLRRQLRILVELETFEKLSFGPRIFFSSISLLLLQKWKREGKMNTGIKC